MVKLKLITNFYKKLSCRKETVRLLCGSVQGHSRSPMSVPIESPYALPISD